MIVEATGLRKDVRITQSAGGGVTRYRPGASTKARSWSPGSQRAGKTTTIHVLTTLLRPDAGQVRIAGSTCWPIGRCVR